jgi:hypothetical protein
MNYFPQILDAVFGLPAGDVLDNVAFAEPKAFLWMYSTGWMAMSL